MDLLSAYFTSDNYYLTRIVFQRAMGLMYLLVFTIALNQYRALVGEYGFEPIKSSLKYASFSEAPSLFRFNSSDTFIFILSWTGILLSILAITGITESHGILVSVLTWTLLWILYQSFVNCGGTFYGYGWEILMLEAGFLTIFLGPESVKPTTIIIWLLLWVLFRLMLGAGLIKIRGDRCWKKLTCMFYHYETQPMPNPLSYYFHHLPMQVHKLSALFTHFVELIVPFAFFTPAPVRYLAGLFTIAFQIMLILSGNLSWLNYLTIVLCIPCFDDTFFSNLFTLDHSYSSVSHTWVIVNLIVAVIVVWRSIRPTQNLISPHQLTNASFDPLHVVNTYGAFGTVGRERFEIIIEGTKDNSLTEKTKWEAYEFKGKPGKIYRMPTIISPYHLHLDWQMWFEAMQYYSSPWFLVFIGRLLENDRATTKLIKYNPFRDAPPVYIRCILYKYTFSLNRKQSKAWWDRKEITDQLEPVSLKNEDFVRELLVSGWKPRVN